MKTQILSKFRNAVVFAAIVGAGAASAQSNSASAKANIVSAITIGAGTDLQFGDIAPGSGGTVVISRDPAVARSSTGGVALASSGVTPAAASFSVSGSAGATFEITVPSSPVNITHTDTTTTMSVGTFTARSANNSSDTTAPISGVLTSGSDTVTVGATLTVGSAQKAGAYTGTFNVSVAYN